MRTEGSPEQSLRRVLKAAGYRMRKSRAPISSDNLGGYMIVDMSGNAVAPTFLRFCAPSVQAKFSTTDLQWPPRRRPPLPCPHRCSAYC